MKGVMTLALFHCVGGYCDPTCVYGECTEGDVCKCNPGYKGEVCDESGMLISSLLFYMSILNQLIPGKVLVTFNFSLGEGMPVCMGTQNAICIRAEGEGGKGRGRRIGY